MPAKKGNDRIYLREEERAVLQSMLQEWNGKPNKKTRDAFVSGVAVPKIQELNDKEYGPEIISKNKVAKVQWEKRVSVCHAMFSCQCRPLHFFKAVYTWLKNHKPLRDRQVFKMERKIPLRQVVGKVRAAEIEEIISTNNPDLRKGDKSYPGYESPQRGFVLLLQGKLSRIWCHNQN